MQRSRPGAVSGQPRPPRTLIRGQASHHHAIQTGTPIAIAHAAIATGPSSPAGSVTAKVAAALSLVGALPIVGIAPIMVMWFGFDWQSKAAVVVVMTFFPCW